MRTGRLTARPPAAERLVRLERELERISERLHAMVRRRDRLQREALELRCGLTNEQRDAYLSLRAMERAAR